jgi:RNA 2',3'-cyclic 3'-phosphodiesterase
MTRTFIALEMNDAQQRHLAGVIRQVATALPGIRWVNSAGIHLTLAFLGEMTDDQLSGVMHAVENATRQANSFSYRLSRLGSFGSPRQPRIVWVGIDEPSGALSHLHRVLNRELARRGFEIDKRPFSPHLTLARIRNPLAPDELQLLQTILTGKQEGLVSSDTYMVQHVNVMKSELLRGGAQYTCLQAYTLA